VAAAVGTVDGKLTLNPHNCVDQLVGNVYGPLSLVDLNNEHAGDEGAAENVEQSMRA
jgi:hypothetical protein